MLLAAFGVLALMLAGCNTQGEETTEPAEGEEMTDESMKEMDHADMEVEVEAEKAATDAEATEAEAK